MSVAQQLGLRAPEGDLFVQACSRWPGWVGEHPVLDVGVDLPGLRDWALDAPPAQANEVLLVLARLGAPDGGGERAATGALLWVLMPGAVRVAGRLAPFSNRIDELVAAQLWISARTLAWSEGVRVAPTVLMNTRREVLRDLGVTTTCHERERPVEDLDLLAGPVLEQTSAAAVDRLHGLLGEARRAGVVTREECQVLLALSEHARTRSTSCGRAGLLSRASTTRVARERGVSHTTVVRRAHRALEALRSTYAPQARTA